MRAAGGNNTLDALNEIAHWRMTMNVDTFLEKVELRQCAYRYEPYPTAMAAALKFHCPDLWHDAHEQGHIENGEVVHTTEFLAWLEGRLY